MTKEEILHKHIDKESMDELSENVWPDILEAMEEYHQQQVKSVDSDGCIERSFVATDVHGVLFHDGKAESIEDAIQQTYDAIGDKATTLNFRWTLK